MKRLFTLSNKSMAKVYLDNKVTHTAMCEFSLFTGTLDTYVKETNT